MIYWLTTFLYFIHIYTDMIKHQSRSEDSFIHEGRINSEALEYHDCWFLFTVSYFSFPHDDVIKWKHFPRYWPVVRGIHRSPVNSPLKGQWSGDFMFLHVYKFTAILIKPRMCYLKNVSYLCLNPWWRHQMETVSTLLAICTGNSPVPGEFPTQRPVTRSSDIFFDLHLK